MRRYGPILVLLAPLAFVVGCGTMVEPHVLARLELGMSKSDVSLALGPPESIPMVRTKEDGTTVEMWNYLLRHPNNPFPEEYEFYFENDSLERWGLAGKSEIGKKEGDQ